MDISKSWTKKWDITEIGWEVTIQAKSIIFIEYSVFIFYRMELLQRKDSTSNTKFSSSLTPSGQTPLNNLKANGIGIIQMQHRYSTESLIKSKLNSINK